MEEKFKVVDYIVLAFILVFSVFIGLYHELKIKVISYFKQARKNKVENNESIELEDSNESEPKSKTNDYLIASSSISALPIAFSLLASFYSATALLGMPAEIYQYGIQYWIVVFAMIVTPIIGAYVTGPLFSKIDALSIFEYLEVRFESKKARQIGMAFYVIRNAISSAIFMYGPATSLSYLTNLDEKIAIAFIGVIGTFYTTIGGLRAVIWTDLFQALVMFSSLFFIVIKGIYDIGGFENLIKINYEGGRLDLFDFNPDPFVRQSFWSLFFGMMVYMSQSYCFDQQMIQRFKASKNMKVAQLSLLLNIPGIFIIVSLCCTVGLVLYANFHKCDPLTSPTDKISNPNQLVAYFVNKNLNMFPGVAGLFLGSLFCGSLSSVSSSLNSQAAIIWSDFLKPFSYFSKFDDRQSLRTNKLIVLVCGVISTALSFFISTIGGNLSQISSSLNGAFNAPIIGLFLLGLLFSITNKYGAIFGSIIGLFCSLWISLGAYVAKPKYPKLSVSTELCNITEFTTFYSTSPSILYTTSSVNLSSEGFKHFYSMSYMWYTTFGVLVTVICGVLISLLTGGLKKRADKSLIFIDLMGVCLKKQMKETHF